MLLWLVFIFTSYFLVYTLADLSVAIPQRRRILNNVSIILCGGSLLKENGILFIYLYEVYTNSCFNTLFLPV